MCQCRGVYGRTACVGEEFGSGVVGDVTLLQLCFFFSSRRRHTRLQGDWSSDVCSSDLSSTATDAQPRKFTTVLLAYLPMIFLLFETSMITASSGGATNPLMTDTTNSRSEERRVGEEGRSRWAPDHLKKKKKIELCGGLL